MGMRLSSVRIENLKAGESVVAFLENRFHWSNLDIGLLKLDMKRQHDMNPHP